MDDVVQMALMQRGPRADWRFARTSSRLMVVRMSFVAASAAGAAVVVVVVVAPRRKVAQRGRRRVDEGGIFSLYSLFLLIMLLHTYTHTAY